MSESTSDPWLMRVNLTKRNAPYVKTTGYNNTTPWLNYGVSNLYPQVMMDLIDGSPHHQAIIKTKINYTVGEGLLYDTENPDLARFFNEAFGDTGVDEFMRRTAEDLVTYGGFAWGLKWSYDGTTVANLQHIPFAKVRIGRPSKQDWKSGMEAAVSEYYVSRDWCNPSADAAPIRLPVFTTFVPQGMELPAARPADELFMFYHAEYSSMIDYYPVPDYVAGLDYIELDRMLARFHKRMVQNGMVPTGMFIMAEPKPDSAEVLEAHEKKMREMFQGEENGGELIILYPSKILSGGSNVGLSMPEFRPIATTNNADIYNLLNELVIQKIISIHRLPSPTLAGLSGEGGLGGNSNELSTAAELFHNTVIKGYQRPIYARLRRILAINNLPSDSISFSTLTPVRNTFSENTLMSILRLDELRDYIGYGPAEDDFVAAITEVLPAYLTERIALRNELRNRAGWADLTPEQRAAELADIAAETAAKTPVYDPAAPQSLSELAARLAQLETDRDEQERLLSRIIPNKNGH